jgi:hypothetical protein
MAGELVRFQSGVQKCTNSPIGRDIRLKPCTVWVRIPPIVLKLNVMKKENQFYKTERKTHWSFRQWDVSDKGND